ncbi:MAG: pyruvate, phosphate dikinase [Solirubrobacteraceae bacterium]|nr:pyruvate, phosphate dikinase [Solirubrobacteraceae bacterium]
MASSETIEPAGGVDGPTWVYDFADGSRGMRALLGGKGANVAEMTRLLGAGRIPAGFTITTTACVAFLGERPHAYPEGLARQVDAAVARLEEAAGRRLGDPRDPLLVSVRSGAPESMPGMMDTVLNLGLGDRSVEGLAERTGNARFAWDSYRRLLQMYANVVHGVSGERLEAQIADVKRDCGAALDTDLDVAALRELTRRFKALYREHTGEEFPQDPRVQLDGAIRAVFESWEGERAVHYRRIHGMPDDIGTAVNVQQMVFGNKGETSGSGVAFSRDEMTGAPEPSGDFLLNAQGEDVVSGMRNTQDLADLVRIMPAVHDELIGALRTLERHYGDMQDVEFTIEEGRLFLLQTRTAKRHAQAAVRFAVDAVAEGLLDRERALLTVDPSTLDALLHQTIDPAFGGAPIATGVAASPGAAKGAVVFTAHAAVEAAARGEAVVLMRPFTEADDVAGFHAARGIVTSEGGKASHAALVARGMGRPCVAGVASLDIDVEAGEVRLKATGEVIARAGDLIALDGSSGAIMAADVPLVDPPQNACFDKVLGWADELRRLGVRANADTAADAARARSFGAEGVGLCRTEHMFLEADRQPGMRALILAESDEQRAAAVARLLPVQQADFEALFDAMAGLPVTVRLLDPPLHEFLPGLTELELQVEHERAAGDAGLADTERLLERVKALHESNPMLGTRGSRLGILHPGIYEMQARAIFRAVRALRERGVEPAQVEVMLPLIAYEREIEMMRALVERVADEEAFDRSELSIGTMIELPRACVIAERIARHADFFSFGTNDLTQTTIGFSRDDAEKALLGAYLDAEVFDRSPFETLDTSGVGRLVELGCEGGRRTRPGLKLGICGEHGGDPDSIAFFHAAGLDYVSCSPFRVPVARVAAAQAVARELVAAEPSAASSAAGSAPIAAVSAAPSSAPSA